MTSSVFHSDWLTQRKLQPALKALGANCPGIVVDIGCGKSPYRGLFRESKSYIRYDIVASDPEVTIAPAHAIPMGDKSVDLVLCAQILGDLLDLKLNLTEWSRILKPGGLLVVFETMAYPEHDLPHDYWRVMPNGLTALAGEAGFDVLEMNRVGGLFSRITLLINRHLMEKIRAVRVLVVPVAVLTSFLNIAASGLDRLFPMSAAATDYIAVLRNRDGGSDE